MRWRDYSVEDERLRFVARRLGGEPMTDLCREFGISRKTGHKIFARYRESGVEALADRPRTPGRVANRLAPAIERMIVELRREKPPRFSDPGGRASCARSSRGGWGMRGLCPRAVPSMPCLTGMAWSKRPGRGRG
jgi:transposase